MSGTTPPQHEATARIEHWISEHPSRAYAARFPVDDVQAIIAENTRLHRTFTALGEQTGGFLEAAVAERERYTAENQRLREEADRLRAAWESAWAQRNETRGLLHRFAGHEDTPCWFDHHGDCQEHGSSGPCPVAEARRVLGLDRDFDLPENAGLNIEVIMIPVPVRPAVLSEGSNGGEG